MPEGRDAQPGCRTAALAYLARGWSAIPIEPRGKRPLVSWLEFQGRLASGAEVMRWFRRWPEANVGIVTGAVSGLIVLDVDERLAPLPLWLVRLVSREGGRGGHPLAHWRELVCRRIPEGERNNTIASLAGHLFWHGVDAEVVLELLAAWNSAHCEPPLPGEEVAQVVESIARLHERRRAGAPG